MNEKESIAYEKGRKDGITECIEIVKFYANTYDGIYWAIREMEELKERDNMKKLNEKESFALGVYIAGLFEKCDGKTKEALIMTFLEDIRVTDYKRWLSIMNKNILE